MSGDFKVIGINDQGTESKHGGDDLDKVNRILNGDDLDVTIVIDNDWIFNSSKLILHDASGDNNKITIATSNETADWIITIPTLGGNQTPVFEDLEQTLTEKTLDDVTLTGTVTLPSTASTFLDFVKPHTDSAGENLISFRLDEATTNSLSIRNGSTGDQAFLPTLWFSQLTNTGTGGYIIGQIHGSFDTGTTPVLRFDGRTHNSALNTRPILAISNQNTDEYIFSKDSADFNDNELINAAIDGDDNDITNVPDSALSSNIPLLDAENQFTDKMWIESDDFDIFTLYRKVNETGSSLVSFSLQNEDSVRRTYGTFGVRSDVITSGSETGSFRVTLIDDGNNNIEQFKVYQGKITIGKSGGPRAIIDPTGITTSDKEFDLPDTAGKFVIDNHDNVFKNVQKISHTTEDILTLYRESGTTSHRNTVKFNLDNSESEETTYAAIKSVIVDNTDGEEDGQIEIHTMKAGTLTRNFTINHLGNFFIGSNGWLVLSPSGLSQQRIFTFPDESGTLALQGSLGALGDLTDVDTSSSAPSNGDVLTWNDADGEWVPAEAPGASGGEANTGANVGEGDGEIFKSKVSTTLNFRTLAAGTNISISTDTDEVTIDGTHNHDSDYADINHNHDADYATISHNHSAANITSGTLAVARGGTGKSTFTQHALLKGGTSNSYDEIVVGQEGYVLAVVSGTPAWKSLNSELTGTAEGDGNGSSVEFIIPHDLGTVPSSHFIQCYSHSIPFTWEIDEEDFTVTFDEAPENGTGNVKFVWRVVA